MLRRILLFLFLAFVFPTTLLAANSEEAESHEENFGLDTHKRIYNSFGIVGGYFPKRDAVGIRGIVGAFSDIEFRLIRILGFGFDSYYGYLAGSGNQYFSAFNPGIKIYPMMYKHPSFEPFISAGGHVFEGVLGDASVGDVGMGQGFFGGAGFRILPESGVIGFEFLVRSSFVWMEKPGGGRGFIIPILGFIGVTY